jgi:putative endonuclease
MKARQYFVYILTNPRHTVLYTGVTRDVRRRVAQHRARLVRGFTARYNLTKLVYYELFDDASHAITREKQLKAGSRRGKLAAIARMNPEWRDLLE